ncbi:hypothetical protein L1999_12355 [Neobacillus drentensis]|uniref:hypothetical protein n=1 Tax=Neobacillus drentensis TaxID=220684 RepID=UPI001F254039|nr:hypothetical protein [Neobacillus drentensis]ULT59265.1 hypothetical protein L1999_12355 [Neobacillus drentensis]
MIVYHGSIVKFDRFTQTTTIPQLPNDIDTIGFWFVSEIKAAKPFAVGTETVIEKSKTEFWDDGEPKVVQYDKSVYGFIYRVFIDEPNLKEYESYESFMRERDPYCDYFAAKKGNLTWKDQATLLNKEEANDKFRKQLLKQRYDGFTVRNTQLQSDSADLFCLFSQEALLIADVIAVDDV